MQPTPDGFVYQSRQDEAFAEYEAFAECAFVNLVLAAIKRAAFHAILDEEAPKLTAVPDLIETIRREIG